jgi:hypothetical protein
VDTVYPADLPLPTPYIEKLRKPSEQSLNISGSMDDVDDKEVLVLNLIKN